MKITIKSDASSIYLNNRFNATFPQKDTLNALKQLEGQTLEVDTMWLYPSEFKLSTGLKIDEAYVEEVIDDIRPFYKRCGDCGGAVKKESEKCETCDCDYFTSLESIQTGVNK